MSRDFIDELDDAVAARCSCGCGTAITDVSPSAWFASEACAARWHGRAIWERVHRNLVEKWQAIIGEIVRAFEAVVAAVRDLIEAFVPIDVTLRLAQPTPLPRPPARIDPRGGLSTAPRGRPAFRPLRSY